MAEHDRDSGVGSGGADALLDMEAASPQTLLEYLQRQNGSTPTCPGGRLRRHERLKCEAPFVFEATAGPTGPVLIRGDATLQDISAGGIGFLCGHELTRGAYLRLQFEAFGTATPPRAVVRHCVHVPGTDRYRVGATFVRPDSE